MIDERHKGLPRFGPRECVIPYVMCLVIVLLRNLIGLVLEGSLCPYIGLGAGLRIMWGLS
jgi:hypothetical protein